MCIGCSNNLCTANKAYLTHRPKTLPDKAYLTHRPKGAYFVYRKSQHDQVDKPNTQAISIGHTSS